MADTHGFEVVAEVTVDALRQILRAAWKSGGDENDPGVIPEFFDIPPGTTLGPFTLQDGQVQIPQSGLDVAMAPEVHGVDIRFLLAIQVQLQDPPVPSAGLFDLAADVHAKAPIGTLANTRNVGMLLDPVSCPRANVTVALASGDPIAPRLDGFLAEYIHQRYEQDGPAFPHTIQKQNQPVVYLGFTAYTVDVFAEFFDDPTDPAHQVTVNRPTPGQLQVSIPLHLKIYRIRKNISLAPDLRDPMGIEARIVITAPFVSAPGSYTAQLTAATVTTEGIAPAPGDEGANYTYNKSVLPILDDALGTQITEQGRDMATALGDITFSVPTVAQIEAGIGDVFHQKLTARGSIGIWTPEGDGAPPIQVNDITPQPLVDVLAIALNADPGADAAALDNFVPSDRDFAIAIAGPRVLGIINEAIHRPEDEGGFGPDFPPHRFKDINGHDADLTRLNVTLREAAIHMEGDVTVIDAVAGSIDVDASFSEDVGLHWEDNADGTQRMASDPGEPDVDLSLLAWIVSFLIGFITLGLVGGIVAVVILLIVEGIAERIGGALVRDNVTNQVTGIGAWPENLLRIGRVRARFINPIDIHTDGLVFSGSMVVTSTHALTAVVPADAGGRYRVSGGAPVTLTAAAQHPAATYRWTFDDGTVATSPTVTHVYGDDGFYVTKLTEVVQQPGGARSRNFAMIEVEDVAPSLDVGADRTVDEGQQVVFTATFTDPEWLDRHEATWDWGDGEAPEPGTIIETHDPPQSRGTVTGGHAWCDDGSYTVTLVLRDDGGAVTRDTAQVTVHNVAPTVDAGPARFAYPCSVLTLEGHFVDPGWCDHHTATWDFGDCTGAHAAIIHETNEPPAARGVALHSHVYQNCGTYQALCTVKDDNGGVGQDTVVVRVVDVVNKDFEDGFRRRQLGSVANGWEPYTVSTNEGTVGMPGNDLYFAEELVVHGGQRSQGIRAAGSSVAGILQRIGANPGWDYQASAWCAAEEGAAGALRIGLDPEGGTDPASPRTVWADSHERPEWAQVATRIAARGSAITIFLELNADAGGGEARAWFDDVSLIPVQPFCPEPVEPEGPREACVDFRRELPGTQVPPVYEHEGFTFVALDKQVQRIVSWGPPPGESKLELRAGGLFVRLPFRADLVRVRSAFQAGRPVVIDAFDGNGNRVGGATSPAGQAIVHLIEIVAPGMTGLRITAGAGEAILVEVRARPDWRPPEDDLERHPQRRA
jgi:PKD domain